jgi:hypothetical protein
VSDVASSITEWLTADHRRLEALLDAAERTAPVDLETYGEFRRGLLRHIGIEEKLLLPAALEAQDGLPLAVAARLRLDHGAIAALLVPTPTARVRATLRHVLACHNPLEEGADGLYAACDRLLASRREEILGRMRAYPSVPVSAHNDGPGVMAAVERALARAGHSLLA